MKEVIVYNTTRGLLPSSVDNVALLEHSFGGLPMLLKEPQEEGFDSIIVPHYMVRREQLEAIAKVRKLDHPLELDIPLVNIPKYKGAGILGLMLRHNGLLAQGSRILLAYPQDGVFTGQNGAQYDSLAGLVRGWLSGREKLPDELLANLPMVEGHTSIPAERYAAAVKEFNAELNTHSNEVNRIRAENGVKEERKGCGKWFSDDKKTLKELERVERPSPQRTLLKLLE